MATFFIDLDGCIFFHGTNEIIPGANELLEQIIKNNGDIIFTTYRGDKNFKNHSIYSKEGCLNGIRMLKIKYKEIIFDVDSPRIIINDSGAFAINHNKNDTWQCNDLEKIKDYFKGKKK